MRIIALTALPLIALAAPAQAQVAPPRVEELADRLQEPAVQDGVAAAVSALAGIVLDTRVGRLAHLMDPATDVPPDATLRDVKRRDDPYFEQRLRDDTRRSVARAGAAAGDMAATAGELGRTADRLQRALAPLIAYAGGSLRD